MITCSDPRILSRSHRWVRPAWLVLYGLAALLLVACGSSANPAAATTSPAPTLQATEPPASANYAEIEAKLRNGPHGIGYDLGRGPNTYCARCHSPQNWDPAARVDPPPNCVSCKFPTDAEPRQAVSNPLIPAGDWHGITCEVCHLLRENQVMAQIGYLDARTGYHQTVGSTTELCNQCHTDTQTLQHLRSLGDGAHAGFTCTQCHDPHSLAADCATAGCHPALEATSAHPGSASEHQGVSCVACHDASGLAPGPLEDGKTWTVFRETALLGRTSKSPYQSHTLQKQVDCARCHYPANPWNLALLEATPAP